MPRAQGASDKPLAKPRMPGIEGEGHPRAAVRDGLTAVGVLTGSPGGPLVRPLSYLADDEVEPSGPIDAARGLVTGASGQRCSD